MADTCTEHAWASVGVTVVEATVTRVGASENCPGWTRQPLGAGAEVDWANAWLAGRVL